MLVEKENFFPSLNPEETIHFEYNEAPLLGFYSIYLDDTLLGNLINSILPEESQRRPRMIIYEDRPITAGIWTQEQAIEVCKRFVLGPDGNLRDPKENLGQKAYEGAAEIIQLISPILIPILRMIIKEEE